MTAWGMTVDLNRCVGCQTCTIACKHANATPPGVQWRKVIDVEYGSFPDVQRLFVVTGCQHCENPPCVPVCPSGATARRDDGLVTIDYDICIGCASCVVACPYQARTIQHEHEWYYDEGATAQEMQRSHEERLGVANKCTFCIERIDDAVERGLTPGISLESTPACAASCISQALKFGDMDDPDSDVSRLVRENDTFQMHEELGTNPRVRYLYEVPEVMPGRDPISDDANDAALLDPHNPLVGKRQSFWDYRAAMNFALGGMASGLAVIAWLAYVAGWIEAGKLQAGFASSGAIMAVGLFFVFLKLGRPARFLFVLRRPQTSWMTRETYCVAVFYPAVAASIVWAHPLAYAIAALAAVGFLVSQANILFMSKGIPAWRTPLVPWMLIATGIFEGAGLLTLITNGASAQLAGFAAAMGVLNAAIWHAYRKNGSANGIGPQSMRDINGIAPVVLWMGYALPAVMFGMAVWSPTAGLPAGMIAAAGGFFWKYALVTQICHQQGFVLPKVPSRGSGSMAAPIRSIE